MSDTEDWVEFHIPSEADALWGRYRKRPRFLADANIPTELVQELRAGGIDVRQDTATSGLGDPEVLNMARREKRVLLTFDQGFWDERRYPTHSTPGVLIVKSGPEKITEALSAIALVYDYFVRYFPGDAWNGVKVLARRDGFSIRMRTHRGRTETVHFKEFNGVLLFREDH